MFTRLLPMIVSLIVSALLVGAYSQSPVDSQKENQLRIREKDIGHEHCKEGVRRD